jgi:hypothetical protein
MKKRLLGRNWIKMIKTHLGKYYLLEGNFPFNLKTKKDFNHVFLWKPKYTMEGLKGCYLLVPR